MGYFSPDDYPNGGDFLIALVVIGIMSVVSWWAQWKKERERK